MLPKNISMAYLFKRDADEDYEAAMAEIDEKKGLCKKLEYGSKVTGLVGDLLGDIPDPTKVSAAFAMTAHLAQAGFEITGTALECDDVNFDEIKLIMNKRFADIDKKLDVQTEALEEVSLKVSETLNKIDILQSEMYRGFRFVLNTIENKEILKIINKIDTYVKRFKEIRQELNNYKRNEYIDELSKGNNIFDELEKYSDPGNSLYSALYELIDKNNHYAVPENAEDDKAFQALFALFYGTQTYFSVKAFLMKQYVLIANYNYEEGNFDQFNKLFAIIKSMNTKFKTSLSADVIQVLNQVKNKNFINDVKNELYKEISIDALRDLEKQMEGIDFNMIDDVDEMVEVKDIDFSPPDVTSKYGDWKDKSTVSYAVQLRSKNKFSKFSTWSKPEEIGNKANPTITVPKDNQSRERLIFRKFDRGATQFIGVIQGTEIKLRDINRDLYNAAGRGDQDLAYAETKLLIENGADINAVFEQGRTLLHAAAIAGNDRVATDFLFNHLDKNSQDNEGYTPLHLAAESNQGKFVQELIKQGVNVNAQTKSDQLTALHIAAKNGYSDTVEELLKSSQLDINAVDKVGFTALHHATHKKGNARIVSALLEKEGININPKTKLGLTPLHLAAVNGFPKVLETLYNSKKFEGINETNEDGMTALHYAAMSGKYFIAEKLLSRKDIGINNITIKNKWTPLHFAIYFKKENVASLLLSDPRVDIKLAGDNDVTPLHLAVAAGLSQTASNLINKGADKDAKVKDTGFTAAHLAILRRKPDMLLLLINNKVNLNAQAIDGTTPLHLAVKYRKMEFLEALLDADADVTVADNNGIMAVQIAIVNMDLNFVRAIVEKNPSIVDLHQGYLQQLATEKNFRVIYHYLKNKDSAEYAKYYGLEPLEVFRRLGVNELYNIILNPHKDPNENNDNYNSLVIRIYKKNVEPCIEKEKEGKTCEFSSPISSRITRSIEFDDNMNNIYPLSKNVPRLKPRLIEEFIPIVNEKFSENKYPVLGEQLSANQNPILGKQLSANKNFFLNPSNNLFLSVNTNNMLLLLDVIVRKLKNEKYAPVVENENSSLESRAKALEIIEKFENFVNSFDFIPAAERINFAEVSSKIYKALKNGNDHKVVGILCSSVEKILKPGEKAMFIKELSSDGTNLQKEVLENALDLLTKSCLSENFGIN